MMAVGGANENVLSLVIAYCPPYLSIWLMTWIILNISASFYPMVLNNEFYRYGYIMPIHNAVDIYKVIFLNLTKRKMGRNYGILVAWVALNTSLMPFCMKFAGKKCKKMLCKQQKPLSQQRPSVLAARQRPILIKITTRPEING